MINALESSRLKEEQQEVETLVDYLEGMENQFSRMLSELREMQGTLSKIQDKGIQATVPVSSPMRRVNGGKCRDRFH